MIFLVDGFNLYHSIRDIGYRHKGLCLKWLNIYALCSSYIYLLGKDAKLKHIYYFSAYAYHLNDPQVIQRHKTYIRCLESTRITPILGRFKPRSVTCTYCKKEFIRHEEKETDVAIGTKLLELFHNDECDIVAMMTGDTDLAPAIKTAKLLYPGKTIIFIFPFGRRNKELAQIASNSFNMHVQSYKRHQFPDPVVLSDGTQIFKPAGW